MTFLDDDQPLFLKLLQDFSPLLEKIFSVIFGKIIQVDPPCSPESQEKSLCPKLLRGEDFDVVQGQGSRTESVHVGHD